jgi:hypothetical protein
VIVAPDTVSTWALCALSVSAISFGTAAVVCGWFGCWSMRNELILSPSKVTSTWTVPLEVLIAVPWTTFFEEADDEVEADGEAEDEEVEVAEGVGEGVEAASVVVVVGVVVVVPVDGS